MSNGNRQPLRPVPFNQPPSARQPSKFLWLYALAWAGGAVAYVPFLTILLPVRIASFTRDSQVEWLAYMTFCGALSASVAAILFGWLSDRTRSRRPWVAAGLVLTIVISLTMSRANDLQTLLLLIILWQLALNMMLGPLAAWAADHVPRTQLGFLGGLLAFSPAMGALAGALITAPGIPGWDARMSLVAVMVALCVMPALLLARPARPNLDEPLAPQAARPMSKRLAASMWLARFLVQICEGALFAYLYYYFRSVDPSFDAVWIARLFGAVLAVSVPVSLFFGRWSDRHGRPMAPLVASAAAASVSLLAMALSRTPAEATAAYVCFGLGATTFLSLHSAQTFRVLRQSKSRGRDLGLFNLTNTGPSLIMPVLAIAIVPSFGYSKLLLILAALALLATFILWSVANRLRRA